MTVEKHFGHSIKQLRKANLLKTYRKYFPPKRFNNREHTAKGAYRKKNQAKALKVFLMDDHYRIRLVFDKEFKIWVVYAT